MRTTLLERDRLTEATRKGFIFHVVTLIWPPDYSTDPEQT